MKQQNKTLADYAISYKMSVACFNPTATVKEVRQATAKEFGCKEDQTTGTVYLVLKEFTTPLKEKVRFIRDFFEFNTIKLGDIDIIPSMNFWRIAEFVRVQVPLFDKLAEEFLKDWEPKIKPKSIAEMNRLGVILEQKQTKAYRMKAKDVADRIYFKFSKTPMGDTSTIANMQGLTDDLRNAFATEIEAQNADITARANEKLNARLKEVLTEFVSKMKKYKPDSKQRMHDSIISNIGSLVDLLPSLVVGDDSDEIVNLATRAKALTNYDVDLLKESAPARREAAKDAQSILDKMKF